MDAAEPVAANAAEDAENGLGKKSGDAFAAAATRAEGQFAVAATAAKDDAVAAAAAGAAANDTAAANGAEPTVLEAAKKAAAKTANDAEQAAANPALTEAVGQATVATAEPAPAEAVVLAAEIAEAAAAEDAAAEDVSSTAPAPADGAALFSSSGSDTDHDNPDQVNNVWDELAACPRSKYCPRKNYRVLYQQKQRCLRKIEPLFVQLVDAKTSVEKMRLPPKVHCSCVQLVF